MGVEGVEVWAWGAEASGWRCAFPTACSYVYYTPRLEACDGRRPILTIRIQPKQGKNYFGANRRRTAHAWWECCYRGRSSSMPFPQVSELATETAAASLPAFLSLTVQVSNHKASIQNHSYDS